MQDRYLHALQTKREETARMLLEADANGDRIAKHKLTATQEKITNLERKYLEFDDLPNQYPNKTAAQLSKMKYSIKQQILRLTDDEAREIYNNRGKEFMKRQRDEDNEGVDKSKKQGTEEYRQAKIAEWERKLQEADTPGKKQMAQKRLRYFKNTDEEERTKQKKQHTERQKKYAAKKKDQRLQQESENSEHKMPAATIKRVKVEEVEQVIENKLAEQPVSAVIISDSSQPFFDMEDDALDLDIDLGPELDAVISNIAIGTSDFNVWNSRMQNAALAPKQEETNSPKKHSLE